MTFGSFFCLFVFPGAGVMRTFGRINILGHKYWHIIYILEFYIIILIGTSSVISDGTEWNNKAKH